MKETKKQTFQNSFVALLLLFRGKTIGYSETKVHSHDNLDDYHKN
jgi:hypothetical protein